MSNIVQVRDVETGALWTIDVYNNTRTMRDESGQLVTMDLGQADVHIDSALSNYAAMYKQWDGIADQVAPVFPTPKASDKYFTWNQDDAFQGVEDLTVGPESAVKEISGRLSNSPFSTAPFGIGAVVPTELSANADAPLRIEMAYLERCMNVIMLGREARVANLLMTSGNWSGGYTTTLGATAKWNAGSTSNPVADLYTAIENSLTPVRAVAMSERTWHDFVQNASVQKYTASKVDLPPLPNASAETYNRIADQFSALLGLPPFLIGRMRKKTANTPTYGYVWGDNVALIYNVPSAPVAMTPATARTFRWTGADSQTPDGTNQGGFLVRSYFDPRRGARGSRVMVVTHNDAEVMTSVLAGGLIINAHQ